MGLCGYCVDVVTFPAKQYCNTVLQSFKFSIYNTISMLQHFSELVVMCKPSIVRMDRFYHRDRVRSSFFMVWRFMPKSCCYLIRQKNLWCYHICITSYHIMHKEQMNMAIFVGRVPSLKKIFTLRHQPTTHINIIKCLLPDNMCIATIEG